jgi:hypothetical protein
MPRWISPKKWIRFERPPFHQRRWQLVILSFMCWLILLPAPTDSALAMDKATGIPLQNAKQASPHVRSAMAVLATLQQAAVLPPEGTREADRIIQGVIQIQSVFAKGTDPSIQEFARRALTDKHGEQAATNLEQFRASGWTADMLEALADADFKALPNERETLAMGLSQFNLSVDDFRRFMQLVRDGRSALTAQGLAFDEVYTQYRNTIPGSAGR